MTGQPGETGVVGLEPVAAETTERALGGRTLVVRQVALPGDQDAIASQQWEAELDQLGEGCDGAGGHRVPLRSVAWVRRQRLSALGGDGDAIIKPGRMRRDLEERGLLRNRLDEQRPLGGERRRERKAGEPTPAPEIDEPGDAELSERFDGGQRIEDVEPRGLDGVADRGEVDRRRPREQEPEMAVDGFPGRRLERKAEVGQARIEGRVVGRRERRGVINARRERLSLAAQEPLLRTGLQPPVSAAPGVVVRRTAG